MLKDCPTFATSGKALLYQRMLTFVTLLALGNVKRTPLILTPVEKDVSFQQVYLLITSPPHVLGEDGTMSLLYKLWKKNSRGKWKKLSQTPLTQNLSIPNINQKKKKII
ncbi:transmembrane protein, putative (macronuclear) [Tetrahymena thermophila SB210]|uniref:Transmembrane protein, putative n=1 Tax=Tetrahymena thermophila (strain SB210) TaxID=312017 RepID=I7M271_TETTS|nr:transmembrane protein, putative [Tetrahymena thermophila SB210]EAR99443.2 transmembrane protein, putative [Tetrahymena thermophila SB210]|eukprot:XP_001019688.2 transmembrane protein, putative [Tetrahymena thermophila SB210]